MIEVHTLRDEGMSHRVLQQPETPRVDLALFVGDLGETMFGQSLSVQQPRPSDGLQLVRQKIQRSIR